MTFQTIAEPVIADTISNVRTPAQRGGAFGWLTPYLAAIAAHNADVAARAFYLHRDELHFIALCLALMGNGRDDADHLGAFARGLGVVSRRTLVANSAALGRIDPAPGLYRLHGRLSGSVWRPASYRRLNDLMNEPHARRVIRHLPSIGRRTLATLWRLPAAYRTHGVLKMIRHRRDISQVVFAIEIVRRVRTDLTDRQIIASLEKAESDYIRDWVEAHYEKLPFPEAPVGIIADGDGAVLHPLASYADLRRTGRDYNNCADTYLWRVLTGRSYLYRCEIDGADVAMIELKPVPGAGWAIDEARGLKNDELDGPVKARIFELCRRAGFLVAPQAQNSRLWFDLE